MPYRRLERNKSWPRDLISYVVTCWLRSSWLTYSSISRLIPNKTPRKLEVLTSVFWGVSFCVNRINYLCLRVALPILYLDLYILTLNCTNFTFASLISNLKQSYSQLSLFRFLTLINYRALPLTNRVRKNIV